MAIRDRWRNGHFLRGVNRGWAVVVAVTFTCAGALILASGSGGDPTESEASREAPSFEAPDRPVDTSPFEPYVPQGGATTFREAFFGPEAGDGSTPTGSPPTTTTSLPPPDPDQPAWAAIARFANMIERASAPAENGRVIDSADVASDIRSIVAVLEGARDPDYAPAIDLLRRTTASVSQQTAYDGLRNVLVPLAANSDPADAAALQPVFRKAQEQRREIAAGVTSGRPTT